MVSCEQSENNFKFELQFTCYERIQIDNIHEGIWKLFSNNRWQTKVNFTYLLGAPFLLPISTTQYHPSFHLVENDSLVHLLRAPVKFSNRIVFLSRKLMEYYKPTSLWVSLLHICNQIFKILMTYDFQWNLMLMLDILMGWYFSRNYELKFFRKF
jgi:hypothetical protein